jgi:ubiquinone/menaquinone biosynthesis C-methylase UbiE
LPPRVPGKKAGATPEDVSMERLSCTSTTRYNATEAAIHMARYQLAAPYCKGKRILDVACGEGYGSYALRQLGAAAVDGVDNSQQAITNAQALFAMPGISFHLHDAESVDELFPETRFDIIVCLETIEHLSDPKRFLSVIKKLAGKDAVIIVTCPNDHWYYATEDQSNPFHIKKYSFEAFRELTISILGNASAWGYGSPVIGFGAVTDELVAGNDTLPGQTAMLDFRTQASAIMLPPRGFSNIGPRNCSYFVGIWGGDAARVYTSAVVPISMDHYANLVSWEAARLSPARLNELENERAALLTDKLRLEQRIGQTQSEFTDLQERSVSLGNELERAAQNLQQIRREHAIELDVVQKERQRYRIQAFALAKEFDLISAQVGNISSERDAHLLALMAARQTAEAIAGERDRSAAERDRVAAEKDMLAAERDRVTAEKDILTAERDRVAAEKDILAAERDRVAAEKDILVAERDRVAAEKDILTAERNRLATEQEVLQARLRAQEGLRYLTKATCKALVRRVAFTLKPFVIKPARLAKPYLPAPVLSAAQRIARALRL